MITYDQWKTSTPPEELANSCYYCGEPCEGMYCNDECKVAEIND